MVVQLWHEHGYILDVVEMTHFFNIENICLNRDLVKIFLDIFNIFLHLGLMIGFLENKISQYFFTLNNLLI